MRVYVLSTGDELVRGRTTDLNAGTLARAASELGLVVVGASVVGDDEDDLVEALGLAASRADVVLCSGGLGPTEDDCTRRAVARACGVPLERRPDLVGALRDRYAARGREMPASNLLQADVPQGAEVLPNPVGTAPGFLARLDATRVFALPGPPHELAEMLAREVRPRLTELVGVGTEVVRTRTIDSFGLPEATVGERLGDLMLRGLDVQVGTTARLGTIRVVLHALGAAEQVESRLTEVEEEVVARLGDAVFARDGRSLAAVVVEGLRRAGLTVATAESCTGGLVAGALTEVPGASDVFSGGVVAYSAAEKRRALGVSDELIREHTVVSEPVARAMAEGVRLRVGADLGVSVTGVAGPGPDADGNPEGLVFVALSSPEGTTVRRLLVPGARRFVRALAAKCALDLVRRRLPVA